MISKSIITRWNKKFKAATKAGKRVLIAKDVIEQIKSGKYKPESIYTNVTTRLNEDKDFQSNFDKLKCKCCGVGACLISLVKFTNNASIGDIDGAFVDSYRLPERLENYFSKKQLALIETVFEQHSMINFWGVKTSIGGYWDVDISEKQALKLKEDILLFQGTPKKRLIQIMDNIVRNNGTFIPSQG